MIGRDNWRVGAALWALASSLVLVCVACGTTEGPLLRSLDAGAAGGSQPSRDSRVTPGMRVHYQITGTPRVNAAADLFVLDLFDADEDAIQALHAAGRIVVAYFSAGSFEPWREDREGFPSSAIGSPLDDYPNERWLDPRDAAVRAAMQARLMRARDKGFDGVLPSSLGAYSRSSGFTLSAAEQLDYDRFLATTARNLGLTPGLSGDFPLSQQLAGDYDWAIAFGCLAAGSCEQLQPLIERDLPVFDLEVEGELTDLCARAEPLGIDMVLKQPSSDAWRSCP